jgi:plasmid stability protein
MMHRIAPPRASCAAGRRRTLSVLLAALATAALAILALAFALLPSGGAEDGLSGSHARRRLKAPGAGDSLLAKRAGRVAAMVSAAAAGSPRAAYAAAAAFPAAAADAAAAGAASADAALASAALLSAAPPAAPVLWPPQRPWPQLDADADVGVFSETSLARLMGARPWRADVPNRTRVRSAAYARSAEAEANEVLIQGGGDIAADDPDFGLSFAVPAMRRVDRAHLDLDAARRANEAAAELALVVPTSPRSPLPYPADPGSAAPHYFAVPGDCGGRFVYRTVEPREPPRLRERNDGQAWMRELADACDAEARCVSFDFWGNLRDDYSPGVCKAFREGKRLHDVGGGRWRPPQAFREEAIMFFKDMPAISAQPHRVLIHEFALAVDATTGQLVELRPTRLHSAATSSSGAPAAPPPGRWCLGEGCDAAGAAPPAATWWRLENADVVGCDLRKADVTAGGRIGASDSAALAHWLRSECAAEPRCACVTSAGWLKSSCDITDIAASPSISSALWSRVPLPPSVDYVVASVVSLARELQLASAGMCALPLLGARELLRLEGLDDLELAALSLDLDGMDARITGEGDEAGFMAFNPQLSAGAASWSGAKSPPMQVRELHSNGVRSILRPARADAAPGLDVPPLRTHAFVMDTGRLDLLHAAALADDELPPAAWAGDAAALEAALAAMGDGPERRGAARRRELSWRLDGVGDAYFFKAFTWLRRRFGSSPCFSFVPATSYVRISEVVPPAHFRGDPQFIADNALKGITRRAEVQQQLDYTAALRFAAARAPGAHVGLLEDDSFVCPETLPALARTVRALDLADPLWGGIKLGNGGSGIVVHRELVAALILYLQTRRGSENVDVAMWRFLRDNAWPEYLGFRTRVAHRGTVSTFGMERNDGQAWSHLWRRAHCGGGLDNHWGAYSTCAASAASAAARARGARASLASAAGGWIEREFRCSHESPLSTRRPPIGDNATAAL